MDKLQTLYHVIDQLQQAGIDAQIYRMFGEKLEVFIGVPGISAEEIGRNGHQADMFPLGDRGVQNQENGK